MFVRTPPSGRLGRAFAIARLGTLVSLLSVALVTAGLPRGAFAQDPAPTYAPVAQPVDAATAMADGDRDAHADTNGAAWFAVGCLVGVLGVLIAYVIEPSPPPTRMLGKSPEYVAAYTQGYRYAGKQAQGGKALTGCLVGTLAWVAIYAIALSSATTTSSTY